MVQVINLPSKKVPAVSVWFQAALLGFSSPKMEKIMATQIEYKQIKVWDLPARLFHWTLVVSFLLAYLAKMTRPRRV